MSKPTIVGIIMTKDGPKLFEVHKSVIDSILNAIAQQTSYEAMVEELKELKQSGVLCYLQTQDGAVVTDVVKPTLDEILDDISNSSSRFASMIEKYHAKFHFHKIKDGEIGEAIEVIPYESRYFEIAIQNGF